MKRKEDVYAIFYLKKSVITLVFVIAFHHCTMIVLFQVAVGQHAYQTASGWQQETTTHVMAAMSTSLAHLMETLLMTGLVVHLVHFGTMTRKLALRVPTLAHNNRWHERKVSQSQDRPIAEYSGNTI